MLKKSFFIGVVVVLILFLVMFGIDAWQYHTDVRNLEKMNIVSIDNDTVKLTCSWEDLKRGGGHTDTFFEEGEYYLRVLDEQKSKTICIYPLEKSLLERMPKDINVQEFGVVASLNSDLSFLFSVILNVPKDKGYCSHELLYRVSLLMDGGAEKIGEWKGKRIEFISEIDSVEGVFDSQSPNAVIKISGDVCNIGGCTPMDGDDTDCNDVFKEILRRGCSGGQVGLWFYYDLDRKIKLVDNAECSLLK